MAKTPMRSAFIPHDAVLTTFEGPSRTQQNFKEESEINNIVARYQKTGIIEHASKFAPSYGELPDAGEFHTAMNLVTAATSMFEELPSSVRSRFGNEPASFLAFVDDEANRPEMVEMGLLPAPAPSTEALPHGPEHDDHEDPPASPAGSESPE